MKKTKWITLLVAFFALMATTSCLDDDSSKLSDEQVSNAMKAMKGDYTGTMKWKSSSSNTYDSLNNVTWTVNDTAIIIHDFPVSTLAVGVANGTINDSLRTAMKAAGNQDLPCAFTYYYTDEFLNPYCMMNIMPYSVLIKDAEINTHKYTLKVNFLNNNTNSLGYFNNNNKGMEFYFRTYNLVVGEQTQYGNFNTVYYQLVSTTK